MRSVLIFGHKKPDTDAVTSSIALAELKRSLGINAIPYVLGNINNETKFVLNYFHIREPKYLNDVKLQIKDLNYEKNSMSNHHSSIFKCYNYLCNEPISILPIVDKNKKFIGAISMKDITKYLINYDGKIKTSYKNIIETINGREILKYDELIEGIVDTENINNNSIIITNNDEIIKKACISCAKLIITKRDDIDNEIIELASINKVNIIKCFLSITRIKRLLALSNYVSSITTNQVITINEYDYVDDFITLLNETKLSNYPVLNKYNECLGIIKYSNINETHKKQVILVDHNEFDQSVDGLNEADIVEIIDHHKIGSASTSYPINFRNMPVGSTNTIIWKIYQENNVDIKPEIAGIMLAGIISDTLMFKSPTTTFEDIKAVERLSEIANIDYKEFANKMFEEGNSIEGLTPEEVIFGDFKNFNIDNKKIGISQVFTTGADKIIEEIEEYTNTLNKLAKINEYHILALFITDIIREGSYIIYNDSAKDILMQCFNTSDLKQGYYLDNILSRKKQIIPNIVEYIEKK